MSAEDPSEAIRRWLWSLQRELRLLQRVAPDAVLVSHVDGTERGIAEQLDSVDRDLTALGANQRSYDVSDTKLASDFGDLLGPDGRRRYSELSSVAHGESLGIGNFVGITTGTRRVHQVVGLPAWYAQYCAETVFVGSSTIMRMALNYAGHTDVDEVAATRHDNALAVMQAERISNAYTVRRSAVRFER